MSFVLSMRRQAPSVVPVHGLGYSVRRESTSMPDHKPISSSLVLACVALAGCGPEPRQEPDPGMEHRSPSARPEIVEALRQDQQAPRHPADGGGQVRLVQQPELVRVSQPGSWLFEYEAGPLGIAQDGWLFFQVKRRTRTQTVTILLLNGSLWAGSSKDTNWPE